MIIFGENKRVWTLVIFFAAWLFFGVSRSVGLDFDPFGSVDSNSVGLAQSSGGIEDAGALIPEIQFNNNDISMAFQIISDATGWSIFSTEQVGRAKVSLWAKNITAKELLERVVRLGGFIYHRSGDVISVMTYEEYMQYYGLGKEVIGLHYADATSIAGVVKPFMTKLGKVVVHKETNTIVLYESEGNIGAISGIIAKLDSPAEDVVFETVKLRYADCESVAKLLGEIFSKPKDGSKNKSGSEKTGNGVKPKVGQSEVDVSGAYGQVQVYALLHANQVVVVGTKGNVEKVKEIVSMIDVAGEDMVLEVLELKYADAEMVASTLSQVFGSEQTKDDTGRTGRKAVGRGRISDGTAGVGKDVLAAPGGQVEVYAIGRTNQIIIKAFGGDMARIKKLVGQLDTFVEPTTRNYHFVYVDAAQIYQGLERVLDVYGRYGRSYERGGGSQSGIGTGRGSGLTLVERTNSVLLTAPPSLHRIMSSIQKSVDVSGEYEAGMIRVYKIENADVEEIATTVKELIEQKEVQTKQGEPKYEERTKDGVVGPEGGSKEMAQTEKFVPQIEAKVSVNKATNSIVVQATARQHREFEKLIKRLDVRRKQVLIEAKVIEVTTTDDTEVGVELSRAGKDGFAFTSFGLSTIDPVTGARDVLVSPGGAAAVLRPDKLAAVLKLIQSNAHVRIESSPRILVNDNAVGTIESIAEEPTTQVNQGPTTTTTSFAGFVEAGTQFAITPHISEGDYLRIQYQITLNAFGAKPTDPSIPPPRSTSSIQSEATVPDGATIVVGGLQSTHESESVDKIPILGDIPLIGLAFRNTVMRKQRITTYLFITATIMNRTDFSDLKGVTGDAIDAVGNKPGSGEGEDVEGAF